MLSNRDIRETQAKIDKALDNVEKFDKMVEEKEKVRKIRENTLLTLPPIGFFQNI